MGQVIEGAGSRSCDCIAHSGVKGHLGQIDAILCPTLLDGLMGDLRYIQALDLKISTKPGCLPSEMDRRMVGRRERGFLVLGRCCHRMPQSSPRIVPSRSIHNELALGYRTANPKPALAFSILPVPAVKISIIRNRMMSHTCSASKSSCALLEDCS